MTVTINNPQRLSEDTYLLSWSSTETDPAYYIYRDGELIDTTFAETYAVTIEEGESPVFEILDDVDAVPIPGYPARQEICWLPATSAESYRIDEYVDSAWVQRDSVPDDGSPFFSWTTRPLEDVTTHLFRVTPVGANGNDGTSKTYSIAMVRCPDPPDVTITYDDETGTLTIDEA